MIVLPSYEQFFLVPENTSKEEIKNLIIKRRKFVAKIVAIALSAVGLILWFLVNTKLNDLYTTVGRPTPTLIQWAPTISIIIGVIVFFSLQNVLGQATDYVSVKTNEGKLKITLVPNSKDGLWVFFIIGLSVAILILMYVVPIYSLQSSL